MTVKRTTPPKCRFNSPPLSPYSRMSAEELLALESLSYAMKEADKGHCQPVNGLDIFLENAV